MKNTGLGALLKARREGLSLTQRALAAQIGVEASHVAFIENGQRKPSLRLIAKIADRLGLDRQDLFIRAHPEAKALISEPQRETRKRPTPSWQRFIENNALLARYHVTDRELGVLEQLSLLSTVHRPKEFLTILTLIRDIPTAR